MLGPRCGTRVQRDGGGGAICHHRSRCRRCSFATRWGTPRRAAAHRAPHPVRRRSLRSGQRVGGPSGDGWCNNTVDTEKSPWGGRVRPKPARFVTRVCHYLGRTSPPSLPEIACTPTRVVGLQTVHRRSCPCSSLSQPQRQSPRGDQHRHRSARKPPGSRHTAYPSFQFPERALLRHDAQALVPRPLNQPPNSSRLARASQPTPTPPAYSAPTPSGTA